LRNTDLDYIAPSGRITEEWCIGKDFEGRSRGLIGVLTRHLAGGIEENHEKLQTLFIKEAKLFISEFSSTTLK
jgi:hypothetical protein